MKKILGKVLLILWIMLIFSIPSFSYYFNNYQHLIGERAAGMGGAYGALADSATALWYNPAGLARLNSMNISVSASSYTYLESKNKGFWETPSADDGTSYQDVDANEKEFSAVANTVALGIQTGNKSGLALGIFVPFQENITGEMDSQWDVTGSGNFKVKDSYSFDSKYYVIMAGFGTEVLKDLNIGLNMGIGYYESKYKADTRIYYNPDTGGFSDRIITRESVSSLSALTLQSGLGLQYAITENNFIGVVYKSPIWTLSSDAEISLLQLDSSESVSDSITNTSKSYDAFNKIRPMSVSAGYAYTRDRVFSLSLDCETFFTTDTKKNRVVNFKVGAEYLPVKNLALRMGFYTDFSQDDELTTSTPRGNAPFVSRIDYYAGTMSISYGLDSGKNRNRQISWITLGAHLRYGTGEVQCTKFIDVSTQETVIREKEIWSFSIFIAETTKI